MLAIAFGVTLSTVAGTLFAAFIFAVIGFFTQKKLNPRYEDLIENRMSRVAWIAVIAIGSILCGAVVLDLWPWYKRSPPAPGVVAAVMGLVACILGACSFLIVRLKGHVVWQSAIWAVWGATGAGLLVLEAVFAPLCGGLLALLLCASYHPVGGVPPFPVYRGRKMTFPCASCGRYLADYECNAGSEGVCPKCKHSQPVPAQSLRRRT